jgi:hypothetical protein
MTAHRTRKDWRNRSWPSGTNSKGAKSVAARLVRRKARKLAKSDDFAESMAKKMFNHYDINDFK